MGMKSRKTEHELRVEFNPNAMLRVLTLAASVAKNDADKRHVFAVADLTDEFMRPYGGFRCKNPIIGDVDSARALVKGIMRWIEDCAKADRRDAKKRRLKQAQELIDAVPDKIPLPKK